MAASFGNGRVTRDQAAAIPYASMGYRLDDGIRALLVLATDANGEQLWTSAAHVVIVTRDGRIVRTVGLAARCVGGDADGWPSCPAACGRALRHRST